MLLREGDTAHVADLPDIACPGIEAADRRTRRVHEPAGSTAAS